MDEPAERPDDRGGLLGPDGVVRNEGDFLGGVARRIGRDRVGVLFLTGALACAAALAASLLT